MPEVDRTKLYALKDAAAFFPSSHGGTITVCTLRSWLRAGKIKGVPLPGGHGTGIPGTEIARLLCVDQWPVFLGQTDAETRRASEAAMERLRAMGLKV